MVVAVATREAREGISRQRGSSLTCCWRGLEAAKWSFRSGLDFLICWVFKSVWTLIRKIVGKHPKCLSMRWYKGQNKFRLDIKYYIDISTVQRFNEFWIFCM